MTNEEELWLPIFGYEGLYEVSSLGRVKSLERKSTGQRAKRIPCLILKQSKGERYYHVGLSYMGKMKTKRVHQLVAESFLGHRQCGYDFVVDHINFNCLDNRVENLRIITHRENASQKRHKGTSAYVGVFFVKEKNKWDARIQIANKLHCLGIFDKEEDAANAYQTALTNHNNSKK